MEVDSEGKMRRRTMIGAGLAGTLVAGWPDTARPAVSRVDLDRFDPLGAKENYFSFLRPILFDIGKGKPYLDGLWQAWRKTGDPKYGEWALIGMFILWRVLPKEQQVRFARAAQKMADLYAQEVPRSPAGYVWGAIAFGLEALAAGVLDSVHLAPAIQERLERAVEIQPDYMYGIAQQVAAKLYIKAPSFPVSVGNIKKGYRYLEIARPYAEKHFAPWYVILAEAEYISNGRDAAAHILERMEAEVQPKNVAEAYSLDTMLSDGRRFLEAVDRGKYNKYFWDSFLLPAQPSIP